MKLFDKIKNILFEEEEDEIPVIKDEPKKEEPVAEVSEKSLVTPDVPRFRNTNFESVKEESKPVIKEEKSPFQQFDEEEFERIAAINKSRLIERDRKAREEKERDNVYNYSSERSATRISEKNGERKIEESHYERNSNHLDNVIKKESENEVKHFTPSPVISPVYGILDKNYTKSDILPKTTSEGTVPKVMDVDSVRKKAFGTLEEDIKSEIDSANEPVELLEEASDVIVTGDDNIVENVNNSIIEPDDEVIAPDDNDDMINTNDIKITSFEDQVDEDNSKIDDVDDAEVSDEDNKSIEELDKMMPDNENKKQIKEDKKESDSLENDLFNLIDSMYQDKEDNN